MKTAATIFLDYQKAQAQAALFDDMASETIMEADQGAAVVDQLFQVWTGNQASRYYSRGSDMWDQVRTLGFQLRAAAESIRSISTAMYYAEMTALQLAETRQQ